LVTLVYHILFLPRSHVATFGWLFPAVTHLRHYVHYTHLRLCVGSLVTLHRFHTSLTHTLLHTVTTTFVVTGIRLLCLVEKKFRWLLVYTRLLYTRTFPDVPTVTDTTRFLLRVVPVTFWFIPHTPPRTQFLHLPHFHHATTHHDILRRHFTTAALVWLTPHFTHTPCTLFRDTPRLVDSPGSRAALNI